MRSLKQILLIGMSKKPFYIVPDKLYLKMKYKLRTGNKLNIKNPKRYTEKSQWIKLYDRKDIYTKMVDKYESKEFIEKKVGKEYIVETYGIYDSFEQIDFEKLPDKFVMKCTHDSGGLVICNSKKDLNIQSAKNKIEKSLKNNFYYLGREWPYKNVKPRIIIEELLENNDSSDLIEYNFFCFNGIPKIVMTCHGDKRIKRYNDFYDMDFNKLDVQCEYATSDNKEKKPRQFEKMIELSKKLSENTYSLRVDFYIVNNKIKLGELTFFHWAGFCNFTPDKWDYEFGKMIKLPIEKKNEK